MFCYAHAITNKLKPYYSSLFVYYAGLCTLHGRNKLTVRA
ncbi:hypothetical protein BMETH_102_2 [methanotrophic bacterial endosymbiont of Bathymodiolus sp.]|nr:hypothetical protein BMETH_102_2 [methanotrophic bacterial endosymbiont of Bathymodiolus sp.]